MSYIGSQVLALVLLVAANLLLGRIGVVAVVALMMATVAGVLIAAGGRR